MFCTYTQRAAELQAAGHTKENSTELARAIVILGMHARAVAMEEQKKQAKGETAQPAASSPSTSCMS